MTTHQDDIPSPAPSLALRAVLALLLMVGFYVLALGIAGGLIAVPLVEHFVLGRVHVRLALLCIFAAAIVLYSLFPRISRFQPPGAELTEDDHPELFSAIHEIAEATGQPMPSAVYLLPEVNAFVSQRGGIMGIGGKRILGVGLPLMEVLTVSQVRAVLAHEFGHFYGGDTRLGPFIYQTRAAIARAVESTSVDEGGETGPFLGILLTLINIPFGLYADLFLSVTHAVSRAQEYAADALAARTEGADALISSLKSTEPAAFAFDSYWDSEVASVLGTGHLPPLRQGFLHFMGVEHVREQIDIAVAEAAHHEDPHDTHPPLEARIAAVSSMVDPGARRDDRPGTALLADPDAAERLLVAAMFGEEAGEFPAVAWEDVGTEVFLPAWRDQLRPIAPELASMTPRDLPLAGTYLIPLAEKALGGGAIDVPLPDLVEYARVLLGQALCVALADAGWACSAEPGRPVVMVRDNQSMEPYTTLEQYAAGKMSADEWRKVWEEAGMLDQPLTPGA